MTIKSNYGLILSTLAISFLSSCKQNSPFPSGSIQSDTTKSIAQNFSYKNNNDGYNVTTEDKFCTDLLDEVKNPLGKYQWHLYNTGKTAFTSVLGKSGEDINAYAVLKENCLSGNGVYVAVVDSGLEIAHPSLKPNIENIENKSKTWSINFRDNDLPKNDPSPIPEDDRDHGTMVAGIIGMRSNLGFGGSGVAPKTQLSGYNVISMGAQNFQNFVDALGGSDASKGNDIFSMSYGYNNTSQLKEDNSTIKASVEAFKFGTKKLRDGKGAIYVKAAGNGFQSLGFFAGSSCESAIKYKLSCQNSNMNFENTLAEVITVGALNAQGIKSSYSTTGSSLWISAPGGEYGKNKEWIEDKLKKIDQTVDWAKYKPSFGEPAIFTTDVSGKKLGSSKVIDFAKKEPIIAIGNEFNACDIPENSNGNYTNSMNGTSSATPVTSGSVALILEANPSLTWRDVKYILAKTAQKVDPEFKGVEITLDSEHHYQAEQGWVTNAAGFHFSNWYGFGRVNVGEAVKLASNYKKNLGTYIESEWMNASLENNSVTIMSGNIKGYDSVIKVESSDKLEIENVQIRVTLESKYIGDIAIELISPSGTKSIIWNPANAFSRNGNMVDMQLQSNAFYGENSAGEWKIKIVNTGIHKADATFKGWKLKISGHK